VLYSNVNVCLLCRDLILAAILQGKYPSIYEGFNNLVFQHSLRFFKEIHSHLSVTWFSSFVGCFCALQHDPKLTLLREGLSQLNYSREFSQSWFLLN